MSKEAEARVRDLSNHYDWHRHKYGDVRYCIHCHSPLPKTENAPDFYISLVGEWVEAKNSDSSGTWLCSELFEGGARANQRRFLTEHGGWLFIELSDGSGPKNRDAYLIPWESWLSDIEPVLTNADMKSIRRLTTYNNDKSVRRFGADIVFAGYQLDWTPTIGWTIPGHHIFWKKQAENLETQLKTVREEMQRG